MGNCIGLVALVRRLLRRILYGRGRYMEHPLFRYAPCVFVVGHVDDPMVVDDLEEGDDDEVLVPYLQTRLIMSFLFL